MFGTFNEESLGVYVKKVLGGKIGWQSMEEDLSLDSKDC